MIKHRTFDPLFILLAADQMQYIFNQSLNLIFSELTISKNMEERKIQFRFRLLRTITTSK